MHDTERAYYRANFWRRFIKAQNRRLSIAARLRDLLRLKSLDKLTPRQVERIPAMVSQLLSDIGSEPAYAGLLRVVVQPLVELRTRCQEMTRAHAFDRLSYIVIAAKELVDNIYMAECPKMPGSLRPDYSRPSYDKAKKRAERMLTREFAGLTSAERRYAMSAFLPYQSAFGRYQQR